MFKYSNVQISKCSNVQMFKCSNVQMFQCQMSNVNKVKLLLERTSGVPPVIFLPYSILSVLIALAVQVQHTVAHLTLPNCKELYAPLFSSATEQKVATAWREAIRYGCGPHTWHKHPTIPLSNCEPASAAAPIIRETAVYCLRTHPSL